MTSLPDKIRLLDASDLFDEAWYVERYPDVSRTRMSPAEHYVRVGQHLGRKPRPDTDANTASRFITACRTEDSDNFEIDSGLRERIAALRLFDAAWYRDRFAPDLATDADALADYLKRSADDPRIDPSPLFVTGRYVEKNPDATSMAPLLHACSYGIDKGRPVFDAVKVDDFLTSSRDLGYAKLEDIIERSRPVAIVCWEGGNFFFQEIAEYLEVYLRQAGYDVTCGFDLPRSGPADGNVVIVAPHEFCVYGPGRDWSQEQLADAAYLNTEQWHTGWFSLAYKFLVMSSKALDMNPASASGLQALGINTAFLPILPLAQTPFLVDRAPISQAFAKARYIHELTYPATLADRPYDVLFVGAANARREAALAMMASTLADHEAFIHCPRFRGPVRQGDPDMMSTSDLVQIARNTKILLNVHQGESRYFEWHRLFLFGIMEGCVVLTEPCIPNTFVQAGREFIECEVEDMPARLRWLLETAEGQAEMRRVRANCDQLRRNGTDWMRVAA